MILISVDPRLCCAIVADNRAAEPVGPRSLPGGDSHRDGGDERRVTRIREERRRPKPSLRTLPTRVDPPLLRDGESTVSLSFVQIEISCIGQQTAAQLRP